MVHPLDFRIFFILPIAAVCRKTGITRQGLLSLVSSLLWLLEVQVQVVLCGERTNQFRFPMDSNETKKKSRNDEIG
jgi:hypothetical protein